MRVFVFVCVCVYVYVTTYDYPHPIRPPPSSPLVLVYCFKSIGFYYIRYAALCALSYRQTLAATKLVWNHDLNCTWNFLKEISTNGDMSTMDVIFPASPMLLYTQVRTLLLCIVVTGTNMCMCGVLGPCVCVYGVYGVLWLGLPKFPVLHTNTPTIIIHIPFYHLYAPIPPYARPYIPLPSIPALVVHPHIPLPSIPALHTPSHTPSL